MILNIRDTRMLLVFTFIVFITIYIISLFNIQGSSYIILLPMILALCVLKKEFAIILYLIVMPTAGIIPSEENILEAIGLDEIINILTVLFFMFSFSLKIKLSPYQRNLGLLIFYTIIIFFLLNLKNAYYGIYDGDYFLVLKRTLFVTLKYLPVFFIICYYDNFKLRQYILLGLYLSGIILVISQIFNEHLASINLVTFDDSEIGYFAEDTVNRFSGFYNGDPNSAGAFLCMIIGLIFIKIENAGKSLYLYLLILLFTTGIFITASRTAIISFFIISLFFIYNNISKKYSIQLALIFIIAAYFGLDFIINQLSRFETASAQFTTRVEGNRIAKWIFYLQFMIDDPVYFITGSQEEINNRSSHNVYIQMLYNVGIIPLIIFTFTLIKSFRITYSVFKKSLYFILPFFFITMYVGELYELAIFIILSTIICGDVKNFKKLNKITTN